MVSSSFIDCSSSFADCSSSLAAVISSSALLASSRSLLFSCNASSRCSRRSSGLSIAAWRGPPLPTRRAGIALVAGALTAALPLRFSFRAPGRVCLAGRFVLCLGRVTGRESAVSAAASMSIKSRCGSGRSMRRKMRALLSTALNSVEKFSPPSALPSIRKP